MERGEGEDVEEMLEGADKGCLLYLTCRELIEESSGAQTSAASFIA